MAVTPERVELFKTKRRDRQTAYEAAKAATSAAREAWAKEVEDEQAALQAFNRARAKQDSIMDGIDVLTDEEEADAKQKAEDALRVAQENLRKAEEDKRNGIVGTAS